MALAIIASMNLVPREVLSIPLALVTAATDIFEARQAAHLTDRSPSPIPAGEGRAIEPYGGYGMVY